MRRWIVAVLLLAMAVAGASGQAGEDPRTWRKLGLSQEQIDQARMIYEQTQKSVREARAEIDVLRSELRRLLLREPVDMGQVERQLRASLEWEYRLRLAQISRQVELRRLLGDRDWTQVPRLAAGARVEGRIRREVTTLVEAVYSRPLAQGVETALAGGSLLEGLAEGDGLQGLGEGEDFLVQ
jgi:Spy/CpxP family protein refolding chaperone